MRQLVWRGDPIEREERGGEEGRGKEELAMER